MCITLACVQKYLSSVPNQVNIGTQSKEMRMSSEAIWGSGNQLERNTSGGFRNDRWKRFGTRILHTIESYQMAGEFYVQVINS
jgi:hypothetical protein